ncbi:MAG TPA: YccF domain-containing protein, partial [Segetibacter sp.]
MTNKRWPPTAEPFPTFALLPAFAPLRHTGAEPIPLNKPQRNMRPDNVLGNLLWLVFGGFFAAVGYFVGGLVLCITVIGIPFGLQCFKLGFFVLRPFGLEAVSSQSSTGCLSLVLNIIWIFSGGFFAALNHLIFGCLLCLTVIFIPFGLQHFKLIEVSLMPFGKRIVD